MNTAPINLKMRLGTYVRNHLPSRPALIKTGREILPWAAALGGSALVGQYCNETVPAFHACLENVRAVINEHQTIYESAFAAIMLGTIPDTLAQRYGIQSGQQAEFKFKRLVFMSLLGAAVGAGALRWWYDSVTSHWTEINFTSNLKKIAIDQLGLTPPLLTAIFTTTHLIHGGSLWARTAERRVNLNRKTISAIIKLADPGVTYFDGKLAISRLPKKSLKILLKNQDIPDRDKVTIKEVFLQSRGAFKNGLTKMLDILPANWAFWGFCCSWLVYYSPQDLMVFTQNILAVLWHSVLFHKSSSGHASASSKLTTML